MEVFEHWKRFPPTETYSLIDQVRRSSRSIGAQIAEAWGKRRYPKHFVSKMTDADAEQLETQHWIELSLDCEYITNETAAELTAKCKTSEKCSTELFPKPINFQDSCHLPAKDPQPTVHGLRSTAYGLRPHGIKSELSP